MKSLFGRHYLKVYEEYIERKILALILVQNQILAHLRQTLNAYKTSKLRLLCALRRLSVALFHV
jgi:hypothetical protein